MDPRPYHFEYRRPRVANPTYQSLKLYQSIYQLDGFRKQNPEYKVKESQEKQKPQSEKIQRYQSYDSVKPNKITPYRKGSSPKQNLNSSLSQYGNNLLNSQFYDQNRVYKKQSREFDIINYHPKSYRSELKNYPRLTLEDKLIERNGSPTPRQ